MKGYIPKPEDLKDFVEKHDDVYVMTFGSNQLKSMKEMLKEMEKNALLQLVKETNELLKKDDFKKEIEKIADNVKRINKLSEDLGYKAYLCINDFPFNQLKELI